MFNFNKIFRKIPVPLFLYLLVGLGLFLIVSSTRRSVEIFNALLSDESVQRFFF